MLPIIVQQIHRGRFHLGALVLIWIERPPQVCRVIYHLDVHQEVHQEVHLVVHVVVHQEDVRVVVHQEVVHLVVHLEDRVGGIGDNCHR